VLGETLITGIGQGYTLTTPIQLCLMTAQIANGGYKIQPKILTDDNQLTSEQVKKAMEDSKLNDFYEPLYDDQKNIRIVQEAMFSSTNEIMGTSYKSRIDDPKYQFAGKTGTAQVKRISKRERELDLKTFQIPYEERDHALYVAYGPYTNPRYALSIIVEHGGSGSAAAAPMATKLFKLIVDRHEYRKQLPEYKDFSI
jgi:penicillin-binding protein 2